MIQITQWKAKWAEKLSWKKFQKTPPQPFSIHILKFKYCKAEVIFPQRLWTASAQSLISFEKTSRVRFFSDSFVSAWTRVDSLRLKCITVESLSLLHKSSKHSARTVQQCHSCAKPSILKTIFFFLHMLDYSHKSSSFKNTQSTNFSTNSYQNKILGRKRNIYFSFAH